MYIVYNICVYLLFIYYIFFYICIIYLYYYVYLLYIFVRIAHFKCLLQGITEEVGACVATSVDISLDNR